MVGVRVTQSSAGAGADGAAVPTARPGLALRGADAATGRHAVLLWVLVGVGGRRRQGDVRTPWISCWSPAKF